MMKKTILCVFLFAGFMAFGQDPVKVQIDISTELGDLRRSELYNNNSLLRTPSDAIVDMYIEEIGLHKIMRCWVTVEDFWNPKTDEFIFNFPCGWDLNTWDNFYGYLNRFSRMSEEILLNVRGLHKQVAEGEITMQAWREAVKKGLIHYKTRFPKIRYIEVLNEYELSGFAGFNNEQYYQFYQEFYKVINEINTELQPEWPLLIGGPDIVRGYLHKIDRAIAESNIAPMQRAYPKANLDHLKRETKMENMLDFLNNFANDKNPAKKLDFISYHEYHVRENPSSVAKHEEIIDGWCKDLGLPTDLPIFVNEMGGFPGTMEGGCPAEDQLTQAAVMNTMFYYYNQGNDIQAFHWAIQHKSNDRKTQIYDNFRWTPYGISILMQARMAKTEIKALFPKPVNDKGIYSVASKDPNRITLQVWNYQSIEGLETIPVEIDLKNLPESFKGKKLEVKEYLLDSKHNNINSGYSIHTSRKEQLRVTNSAAVAAGELDIKIELEPNAIILMEVTVGEK